MIFARGYCVRVGGGDGFLDDACLQWFKSQAMSSKISSRNIREKALHGGHELNLTNAASNIVKSKN